MLVTLKDGRTGIVVQEHRINGKVRSLRVRLSTGAIAVIKPEEIEKVES